MIYRARILIDIDGFLFHEQPYIDEYNLRIQGSKIRFMNQVTGWGLMRGVFEDEGVVKRLKVRHGAKKFLRDLKSLGVERTPGTARPRPLAKISAWQLERHSLEMDRPITFIEGGAEGKAVFAYAQRCKLAGDDHSWKAEAIAWRIAGFGGIAFYYPDPSSGRLDDPVKAIRVKSYREMIERIRPEVSS